MQDCLIIGAGVIGLSLARELAAEGLRVRVLERGEPGREASWAGAGILPPGVVDGGPPNAGGRALAELAALSSELHPRLAEQLRERTGVDNGYRRSGGVYLARHANDAGRLSEAMARLSEFGVRAESLNARQLREVEPAIAVANETQTIRAAYFLRDEAQLRNPRHVRALLASCVQAGVTVESGVEVEDLVVERSRALGVRTQAGMLHSGMVCVTAGPWSGAIVGRAGARVAIRPIRGQMLLLNLPRPPLRRIVNDGPRYVVPRDDGRVLVGSTEEDVGFEKRTTGAGIAGLLEFGLALVPALADATVERSWAGLRPGTADGLPYLGRMPGLENAYVAAGHFRAGLHLSPGTALVMSQLMRGEKPVVDLSSFAVDRG